MEKIEGYDEAQALTGEYERLEAGGYICKIVSAREEKSSTGKRMLVLAIDIAEGEKKEFFRNRFKEDTRTEKKWPSVAIFRQMLEGEKAAGYLKGMMTSLGESNPNFKWDWDENKLKGLRCGAIFGEEEYEKNDGSVGTTVKVKFIRSVKCIEDGNFKVPEIKKIVRKENVFGDFQTVSSDNDDDLPF